MVDQVHNTESVGVAPRTDLSVLVEGWRFYPHSHSIVNEQQCLALVRRGVDVSMTDAAPFTQIGERVPNVLDPESQTTLASIPPPQDGRSFDVTYRIAYPYDTTPSDRSERTFVFATCDRMAVNPQDWVGRSPNVPDCVTVVVPSDWVRRGLTRLGVPNDRIAVVPHGFDPEVFHPLEPADRLALRDGAEVAEKFVFLHVSSLTGNKNPRGLLKAFAQIAAKHDNAYLVLKGLDGIYQSEMWLDNEICLLTAEERKNALDRMTYIGDVLSARGQAQLYQTADCYIAPYQSEGFNIPALEAAACGLPLILTDGGATDDFTTPEFCLSIPSEFGDHDGDGQWWLKTEVAQIAAQMERAILDESFRVSASLAGPRHVQKYRWRSVVDRLLEVFTTKSIRREPAHV